MTDPRDVAGPVAGASQQVWAYGGHVVAVQGGDVHLYQNRGLVYSITNFAEADAPDDRYLLAQPSRMLDARYRVAAFTGREQELAALGQWRDAGTAVLSACWLHGPAGQGKSRLAAHFAAQSAAAGRKVVTIRYGRGELLAPADAQDLRTDGRAGVLAVVDYADRWPVSLLTLLAGNAIFHRGGPVRFLLLARSTASWQALRGAFDGQGIDTATVALPPLGENRRSPDRLQMFTAARDGFAERYGIADPTAIPPPDTLDDPAYGLPLTVQMAALAAVDAHARGAPPPDSAAALSPYLLRRESRHWQSLYENRLEGLDFATAPSEMARIVFAAALTGAAGYEQGVAIARSTGAGGDPGRLLADHALCYPPSDPGTVLEPLYPDRLAEDYLALTLPGHAQQGFAASPWAGATAARLAAREDGEVPGHAGRLVQFLAAAAGPGRWPHAAEHLAALLRIDPALPVAAGGAALSAVAEVPGLDAAVLETIEACLPEGSDVDLDPGIAAIAERVTAHRLSRTADPAARAGLLSKLHPLQRNAGLFTQACATVWHAIVIYRELVAAGAPGHRADLARALVEHSSLLAILENPSEAAVAAADGVRLYRDVVKNDSAAVHRVRLARALLRQAEALSAVGRVEDALTVIEEALATHVALRDEMRLDDPAADPFRSEYLTLFPSILRTRARIQHEAGEEHDEVPLLDGIARLYRSMVQEHHNRSFLPDLSGALLDLAVRLNAADRGTEALAAFDEAVAVLRGLAQANPTTYQRGLARALGMLGVQLGMLGRSQEAFKALHEAVELYRLITRDDPRELSGLISVLDNYVRILSELGRHEEALAACREAITAMHRVTEVTRPEDRPGLTGVITFLAMRLSQQGQRAEALAAGGEAVALARQLVSRSPGAHRLGLAKALQIFGAELMEAGHVGEALAAGEEAIALWRVLAEAGSSAYGSELAQALINQGYRLLAAGRPVEALAATQEAEPANLAHPELRPLAIPALLALYRAIGVALYETGDTPHAMTAIRCGVAIGRSLQTPPDPEPALGFALCLDHLSMAEVKLGNAQAGVTASLEAVAALHRLAHAQPDSEINEFEAAAYNNLGTALAATGQLTAALSAHQQSVTAFAHIATQRPLSASDGQVDALNNLAGVQMRLGHIQDAADTIEEARAVGRRLAAANPVTSLPSFARVLGNAASVHANAGSVHKALGAAEEAVAARRRLLDISPQTRDGERDLAVALAQLCDNARTAGRLSHALDAGQEAEVLLRRVQSSTPSSLSWHAPLILRIHAAALFAASVEQRGAGRTEQAINTSVRAADLYMEIGDPHTAGLLFDNVCLYQTEAGRPAEAVAAGQRAVELLAAAGDPSAEVQARANLEAARS